MAGNGNARGGLGWVILVVALAVPGVLFYNWWSHLKAEREKSVAAKARGRVPDGGVFQSSPSAKLVNPMTPAVSTDTASAPPAAPVAAVSAAQVAAPTASSMTATAPPLKRDPTLSPFDQVRILEEEEAKRRAAEDLANASKRTHRDRRVKAVDPKTLVNLQGVVSNAEGGFKAIVNDDVLGAGEFIGTTKIKIIKITDLGVTFEYKGRRFSKGVSRD